MSSYDEIELATLIAALPPPPEAWVETAVELPRARREMDELLPRLEADAALRAEATRDLERAIERAGIEPRPALVRELRRRMGAG